MKKIVINRPGRIWDRVELVWRGAGWYAPFVFLINKRARNYTVRYQWVGSNRKSRPILRGCHWEEEAQWYKTPAEILREWLI